MHCKNCGEALNAGQAVCVKCGVKVGQGKSYCANCGAALGENADVCMSCGVAVKKAAVGDANLNGQDKLVMILICFFLGAFGIHNFMMGETKKGILRLVLTFVGCGIGGIFAIIDLIKIAMGTYVVDPNALI